MYDWAGGTYISAAPAHNPDLIHMETAHTKRFMEDTHGSWNDGLGSSGYISGPDRGDYGLVDVSMVAISGSREALVADPLAILWPEDKAHFSDSFFVKP